MARAYTHPTLAFTVLVTLGSGMYLSVSAVAQTADTDNPDRPEAEASAPEDRDVRTEILERFSGLDRNGDHALSREEARTAGLTDLIQRWSDADDNQDGALDKTEFVAFEYSQQTTNAKPQATFSQADGDGDGRLTRPEAEQAGLSQVIRRWSTADFDNSSSLSKPEFATAMDQHRDKYASAMVIGQGLFKSPETALWDQEADVYLVSNINGALGGTDDNGFISRVHPDGTVSDLRWIDGGDPDVVLHGPKGMLFHNDLLVVADVGAVRYFDRSTGKPLYSVSIPDSHMLNDPAVGHDGLIYVTDLGSQTADPPGAVYRITEDQQPERIVRGIEFDRPDGLIAHEDGLLVTPFEAHAKDLYELSLEGDRTDFASVPMPQLDGLLRLPDGSLVVTSWKGQAVYRLVDREPEVIVEGISSPAQIDFDAQRQRLLVPVLQENIVLVYPLEIEE